MNAPTYYERRAGMAYYEAVRSLLDRLSPAGVIIDVGSFDTPVATWGSFARRYTVDRRRRTNLPGVEAHVGDFMAWTAPEPADVVTCLQTLEHLTDAVLRPFARRVMALGRWKIITIPYRWPDGREPGHIQDPFDLTKLVDVCGAEPVLSAIMDGRPGYARLLAVFGPSAVPGVL